MNSTLHLIIGCTLGAFVLGYLLAEMVYTRMLDKAQHQLCEMADQIEDLVDNNDHANQLITRLRDNIEIMDSNALALLNKNRELTAQVQQHAAIFGPDAVESYSKVVERNTQLEALLQLVPEEM